MERKPQILVIRHLHVGIYRSQGGGQSVVYSRHVASRVGLQRALNAHAEERRTARTGFGVIGAGGGWLEIVPHGGEIGSGTRFGASTAECLGTIPPDADLTWWTRAVQRATDALETTWTLCVERNTYSELA